MSRGNTGNEVCSDVWLSVPGEKFSLVVAVFLAQVPFLMETSFVNVHFRLPLFPELLLCQLFLKNNQLKIILMPQRQFSGDTSAPPQYAVCSQCQAWTQPGMNLLVPLEAGPPPPHPFLPPAEGQEHQAATDGQRQPSDPIRGEVEPFCSPAVTRDLLAEEGSGLGLKNGEV